MRVSVRGFTEVIFVKTEGGDKEYKICEWELEDGTFELGFIIIP
jgi:hypothetical protein